MESIAPPGGVPDEDPASDDGYIEAEYEVRKDPLLHRLFPFLKRRRAEKEGRVTYWTFSRIETDYGTGIEYEAREHECKRADLPRAAVHITGMKGVYCLVDMEPLYPEYADPEAEVDENGNFIHPHNYFDAFGYYKYFTDQRIKKGYDALGRMDRYKRPIEWQKIVLAGVAAVVALAVFMAFAG